MIDPLLAKILTTAFTYGLCGSCAAIVVWFLGRRDNPSRRFDQAAAIGFLIGAAFGAFFGIFQSMLVRS
jgi:hypothetical protein